MTSLPSRDPHSRRRFRIAVGASVGTHALAAVVVAALAVWNPSLPPPSPPDESDGDTTTFTLGEPSEFTPVAVSVTDVLPPPHVGGRSPTPQELAGGGSGSGVSRPPIQIATPKPLSSEVTDLIREHVTRPAPPPRAAVTDVADVKQVGHVTPALEPGAPASGSPPHPVAGAPGSRKSGKPLHAPLPADKCVVYVLDRSSSMRLSPDTFDAARAAVLASVEGTPDGGRFQVVAYNGSADVLLPGTRGQHLAADAATRQRVADALADLTPEGRSTHREGLTAAIGLKADYVIVITDADADELADLKAVRSTAAKPTAVYLARATGGKVGKPEPLPE